MVEITSRENKVLKLARSLQTKKGRVTSGLYFVEGRRMAEEALTYAATEIEAILVSDIFAKKHEPFLRKIDESGKAVYMMKESLFAEVCDTETPQGIGVILRMPKDGFDLGKCSFLLVLDGVSEPGNLGTMVRTAEAAGVDGILLLKGCVDLYSPKVVRSTMGSLFRMPHQVGLSPDFLQECQRRGFFITATALRDSVPIAQAERHEKQILIIGSEASGISDAVLQYANQRVRIPMAGHVESLNAAVAAGIAMYALGSC